MASVILDGQVGRLRRAEYLARLSCGAMLAGVVPGLGARVLSSCRRPLGSGGWGVFGWAQRLGGPYVRVNASVTACAGVLSASIRGRLCGPRHLAGRWMAVIVRVNSVPAFYRVHRVRLPLVGPRWRIVRAPRC